LAATEAMPAWRSRFGRRTASMLRPASVRERRTQWLTMI